MKPLKKALPFSVWIVRILFSVYLILTNIRTLENINLNSANFYLSLATVILAVLLVVGGFLTKHSLTVISALLIGAIIIYRFLIPIPTSFSSFEVFNLLMLSISFLFICRGNG
ncbi:MAG TPA: hypothetical protein PLA24_03270 [Tenuifilaceae bacterium]|nr:hypothetical protein [Tenuifilaceae bacterium]HRX30693.1 hypothetical protein [Tenuifilaceae bacterium]